MRSASARSTGSSRSSGSSTMAALAVATALVINVLQLCTHLVIMPMGGEDSVLLNLMQAATLVLTT